MSPTIHASIRCWLLLALILSLFSGHSSGESLTDNPPDNPVSLNIENPPPSIQEQTTVAPRKDLGLLQPGKSSREQMEAGDVHAFRVHVRQGQYLRVVVEQEGIDIAIVFYAPEKQQAIVQMDSPNGIRGLESVSIIAPATGDYIVEIRSEEKGAMAGHYEVSSEGPREPTQTDLQRVAAEKALLEGGQLRRSGTAEARQKAIEKYKEALTQWRALGDRDQEASTLQSIGSVYRSLSDLAQVREFYNQTLAIWQTEKNLYGQAFILNEIGAAVRDLDSPRNALPFYQDAYKLYEQLGDQWGKAWQQNNIGFAHALQGRHREALEYYRQSLSLWEAVHDRNMQATTLNNVGGSLDKLGEMSQALTNYQTAIRLWQETGNRLRLGSAYNNVAVIYHSLGDSEEALNNYHLALGLARELKNERSEANTLNNIGLVYTDWGNLQRAEEYFNQSLPIRQRLKEARGYAQTLDNIGYVNYLLGNYQEALKKYQEALPLHRQAQDKQRLAFTLTHLGMVHHALGDPQSALDYYQQALQIQRESESKLGQAVTLGKIGHAYASLNDLAKATNYFSEALTLWDGLGALEGRASALYGLALVESIRGNLIEARGKIEQAIAIIENLRSKTFAEQLRTTYLATKQNYYELDIDIKMRLSELYPSAGHLEAALVSSENARARSLSEILSGGRVNIQRGGDPKLISQKNELENRLGAVAGKLLLLRDAKPVPKNVARVAREVEALTQELENLSDQYDVLQTHIRAKSPRYAQLMQPQPPRLSKIQEALDDKTLLLEYTLGEKSSYLWAATRSGIDGYRLPGRKEIEKAAGHLRELLTMYESAKPNESEADYSKRLKNSASEYRQSASELGRIVLGPVADRLGTNQLVIVADGVLQTIPFEALIVPDAARANHGRTASVALTYDPDSSPLAMKNEVAYLSSASMLVLGRSLKRNHASKSVAVFADPVLNRNDKRALAVIKKAPSGAPAPARPKELSASLRELEMIDGGIKLDPLPYSLEEAKGIFSVIPAGSGMQALGFDANRAAVINPAISNYRIIHFATHALLNDKHPQFSNLVLSLIDKRGQPHDGFLWLQDIYNLNLPVELVVLSACRTGIGREVRGEGLMSLTRGFLYAGASKVIASLWKVDDEATAALMKSFYRYLLKEQHSATAALRLAKMDVMKAREQWRAPYYWAGFVLHGDIK